MLKFIKGDDKMTRSNETKNIMRTPKEKEKIVKEYLNGTSAVQLNNRYNLPDKLIYKWIKKYEENGLEGLKSQTGKAKYGNPHAGLHLRKPRNKIEELELELMKKDIEIARLKKGYNVKGVGQKKEFVTTFNKNTK
jgi:transposase-like protein